MPVPALAAKSSRLHSLDILRGLAIFGMILSAYVPAELPQWMHHDQFWKDGKLVEIFGLTWVDIVFPFFLVSLGMAVPFALTRRIEQKMPMWQLVGHIFWRAMVLCWFAYVLGNASPWTMDRTHLWTWGQAVLGFVCLVLFLARLPFIPENRKVLKLIPKVVALAGLFILMATVQHTDGSGFTLAKRNIIILIMARVYLLVSILWLITRNNLPLRLAFLAGIFALRLHTIDKGLILPTVDKWLNMAHLGWFYGTHVTYIAAVSIFGSIMGDILYQWSREREDVTEGVELPAGKLTGLLITLPSLTVGGLYFLQMRYVYWGLIFTMAVCLLIHWMVKDTQTSMGRVVQRLCKWSSFLLILGYILEPVGGGISKTSETLSYLLIPTGMATSMLVFFLIVVDDLKWRRGIGFLRVAGSNAMLAYIMGGYFVFPVLHLTDLITPIRKLIGSNLTLRTIWAFVLTFMILFVVNLFTRRKIYLRV